MSRTYKWRAHKPRRKARQTKSVRPKPILRAAAIVPSWLNNE
ncbi:MAG: hypothetical protein P4L74_06585 [Candidatus Doudnabacteria bacterium]|nr:hypothetical protein [Candidatus Doudnabacteria bacterium]